MSCCNVDIQTSTFSVVFGGSPLKLIMMPSIKVLHD